MQAAGCCPEFRTALVQGQVGDFVNGIDDCEVPGNPCPSSAASRATLGHGFLLFLLGALVIR
eukprot:1526117-Rhodomonas_salina.1